MSILSSLHSLDSRMGAHLSIPPSARWVWLLAQIVAHSGDSLVWLAATAAMLVWGQGTWELAGWRILAAILISGSLTALLKRTIQRQRPANDTRGLYIGPDHYAFPSGHAGRTACLVVVLGPLLPLWAAILLAVWALSVGLARVGLGVHFASDIVAGWVVGLTAGLGIVALAAFVGPFGALQDR